MTPSEKVIDIYVSGIPVVNIPIKAKMPLSQVKLIIKDYCDMKNLFFLEQYDDWILGINY